MASRLTVDRAGRISTYTGGQQTRRTELELPSRSTPVPLDPVSRGFY